MSKGHEAWPHRGGLLVCERAREVFPSKMHPGVSSVNVFA